MASRLHEILRKVLYEGLHAAFFVAILLAVISMVCVKIYIRHQVKLGELEE